MPRKSKPWFLYIIKTDQGSLYTGITTDIEARFKKHQSGQGAKFFRTQKPIKVIFSKKCKNKSFALKQELKIKKLSPDQKKQWIKKQKKN